MPRPGLSLVRTAQVAVVASLTSIAAASSAHAQQYPSTMQAVMVNGVWSAWMQQADVVQTANPKGGLNAQVTLHSNYLGAPLMELVTMALVGKQIDAKLELATFSFNNGAPLSALHLVRPQVTEVNLPGADATTDAVASFGVKFSQVPAESGTPSSGKPSATQKSNLIYTRNFRFDVDSLPGKPVVSVAPLVIPASAVVKAAPYPTLIVSASPLANVAQQQWLAECQRWLASGQPRNGTLTFLSPNLTTPVLTERFTGLRVASIATVSGRPTVTLTMTAMSITPAK